MSYVIETYDFHTAISAHPGIVFGDVDILSVDVLMDNIHGIMANKISIVETNQGPFWCESVAASDRIFMKVTEFRKSNA